MATPAEKAMAAGITVDLVMFDGFVQTGMLVDNVKKLKDLPIREDDIFLCTYPKSGTHWTWEILNMIVAGKAEYTKHWQNSAWLEYRTQDDLEKLPSPRIFHTHLRPSHLPDAVWDKRCKVVYVKRNPKDCVVSSFCQFTKQIWKENCAQKLIYTGSWSDYIDLYLDGYLPGGPYFEHTIEWANISEVREGFEMCRVQYEDMKKDCVQEIRRMADYLGRPLSENIYQDISEACSFKNLKHANENLKDQTYHFQWQNDSTGYFRKGKKMSALAEKAMASGFNLDLVVHDGLVQAKFLVDKIKRAKTFAIREDDIFLCTYPKSGTHWTWEILNMIVAGRVGYTKHWLNSAFLENRTEEELEKLESPRIIHTHLLPSQMPDAIWTSGCKVIYVHRNPKDCVVSSFSQQSKQIWQDNPLQKTTFSGSWADFLELFFDGYSFAPCGSYFNYRLQMSTISDAYKGFEVCTVQYEDMKEDCARETKRMAEYLGRPLPDQIYRDIAEACAFKKLKHACETIKDQTYHFKWKDGSSGYFRKGEIGDWKNFFTVAQSERFDKIYEETMKSLL